MRISRFLGRVSMAVLALSAMPLNSVFAADSPALPTSTPNSYNATDNTDKVKDNSGISDFGVGFKPGVLTLDQVPNFDFGIHSLGEAGTIDLPPAVGVKTATGFKAFPMLGDASTSANASGSRSLIVTDQTGSTSGWNVSVKVSEALTRTFNVAADGTTTSASGAEVVPLTSALLAFNVVGSSDNKNSNSGSAYMGTYANGAFTPYAGDEAYSPNLIVGEGVIANPGIQTAVTLDAGVAGDAQTLLKVPGKTQTVSPGSYQLDFTKANSALLYVAPSKQQQGIFKGELTWTLQQNPVN